MSNFFHFQRRFGYLESTQVDGNVIAMLEYSLQRGRKYQLSLNLVKRQIELTSKPLHGTFCLALTFVNTVWAQGVWISHGNNMQQHFVSKCPKLVFNRISMFYAMNDASSSTKFSLLRWMLYSKFHSPSFDVAIFFLCWMRLHFSVKLKQTIDFTNVLQRKFKEFSILLRNVKANMQHTTSSCLPFAFFRTEFQTIYHGFVITGEFSSATLYAVSFVRSNNS